MKNIYKEELKLIMKLALEFRLSLKNICRFLNVEPNDSNQMLFYDELINNAVNVNKVDEFKYLVYETANESEQQSNIAYNLARLYYLKYIRALNRYEVGNSKEELNKAIADLAYTDIEFKKLKARGLKKLTEDDAKIIAKYRIKHALTKTTFSEEYSVDRETITRWENLITNSRLKKKIELLNEYNYLLTMPYLKKVNKKK